MRLSGTFKITPSKETERKGRRGICLACVLVRSGDRMLMNVLVNILINQSSDGQRNLHDLNVSGDKDDIATSFRPTHSTNEGSIQRIGKHLFKKSLEVRCNFWKRSMVNKLDGYERESAADKKRRKTTSTNVSEGSTFLIKVGKDDIYLTIWYQQ
ncbi:uncharacterized protein LOC118467383 isoform X3 [Anopheles albimanus]|uniref:uncharacterized protein LOC118467383 isoform X3 n=1 Tax=Anopheles albimanus TaxID=7167 RepID=UPI001640C7CB|nr:uncharacterized protein LOC118467383 isoform X3 [Anopheles albimanus]